MRAKNETYTEVLTMLQQQEKIEQDKKKFLEHLEEFHGNVHQSGIRIGINHVYKWLRYHCDKDPKFAEKYEEAREEIRKGLVHDAVSILYEKVFKLKETKSVMYFLKCQGKDEGWTEYKEFEGTGKPIVIKIERIVNDGTETVQIDNEDALASEPNIQ